MRGEMGRTDVEVAVRRAIPESRDRMQSDLLVGVIGGLLIVKTAVIVFSLHRLGGYAEWFWISCGCSAGFAMLVWLLRSATGPAAVMGGFVCLNILFGQEHGASWLQTAMPALLTLFVLTFAATRFGRRRKEQIGTAEARRGRQAAQVLANLGVAGLCAGAASPLLFAACLAAIAEATADTVASELGQVFGGRTLLITTWSEVPTGTDGGISVAGTTLGAAGAGVVVLITAATGWISWEMGMVVLGAGFAGLLFDSYLGATVERRGWLGNDLVNFSSTVFSAVLAYVVMRFI
jgi:uncharacterized protein (TIGR00297 family)